MNQIILASHGKLAAGMKETVEFFGGSSIEILEQTMTDSGFESRARALLEQYQDRNCVVFTDLMGGSVNQIFFFFLRDLSFHLITGMNLAVVLECVFTQEEITSDFLRKAVESSKQQFGYMNDRFAVMADDEEE